jgi:AAA+ superfamily predicted ATPase
MSLKQAILMTSKASNTTRIWYYQNRQYLIDYIKHTKSLLEPLSTNASAEVNKNANESSKPPIWPSDNILLPSLETLSRKFHLSQFEKMMLVLCIGAEIDGQISTLCSKIYNNPEVKFPTFDIAFRAFPNPQWKAILPDSNLRRYQLIQISNQKTSPLISSTIRIHERILHYVLGFERNMESGLAYLAKPVRIVAPIADSHMIHVKKAVDLFKSQPEKGRIPVFHLWGPDSSGKLIVAQKSCVALGLGLLSISAELIPSKNEDEEWFSSLLSRECILSNHAVYVDAENIEEPSKKIVARFAENSLVPIIFIGTREPLTFLNRSFLSLEVKRPTRDDQQNIWKKCIMRHPLSKDTKSRFLIEIDSLVDRFSFDAVSIEGIVDKFVSMRKDKFSNTEEDLQFLYSLIQSSSYRNTKTKLGELAEEIIPVATLDDIILPTSRKKTLHTIIIHFKHRRKVLNEWGYGKKSNRGRGIVALFAGESGTGKTMAAESIANELKSDLYRIDLSMVASKYIGETEKNLKKIFDAAESNESILFFDEADALFGKRSEVKDSHDRYANMEVGYLLQRIESYDGVVILATNFKQNLDSAFMRRIRFIVDFPFPDADNREEIWKRTFPITAPIETLDFKFLSKLSITGGHIRNIALSAAFLAAEEGTSISMDQIRRAAEAEYGKLGRTMSVSETGEWPR